MKTIYMITRFPEGLSGCLPYMAAQKGDTKLVLIDGKEDGHIQITRAEAEALFPELKEE